MPRTDHAHIKDFGNEIIYKWYKTQNCFKKNPFHHYFLVKQRVVLKKLFDSNASSCPCKESLQKQNKGNLKLYFYLKKTFKYLFNKILPVDWLN